MLWSYSPCTPDRTFPVDRQSTGRSRSLNFASPDATDVHVSDHVSRCSWLCLRAFAECLESRTGRRQPSRHRRPAVFSQKLHSHRPTAATPWSYAPFRLNRMFPVEGQVRVATLPQQSEALPKQPSEWSRISNCVSPGATDATMSDRASLLWLGLGAFSEYQRCLNARPREKRADGWLLRGERLTAFCPKSRLRTSGSSSAQAS